MSRKTRGGFRVPGTRNIPRTILTGAPRALAGVWRLLGGGGAGEVAEAGGRKIAAEEAAEEEVAGDHVDLRLRVDVDPAPAAAQGGVVVRHLDRHVQGHLADRFVMAIDLDLQVAIAAAALGRDQDSLLD